MKRFAMLILLLIGLSPLGLMAEGTAWGEWGSDELLEQLGQVPEGIVQAEQKGLALLPDYSIPGFGESQAKTGYFLSALLGSGLTYGAVWGLSRVFMSRS